MSNGLLSLSPEETRKLIRAVRAVIKLINKGPATRAHFDQMLDSLLTTAELQPRPSRGSACSICGGPVSSKDRMANATYVVHKRCHGKRCSEGKGRSLEAR